MSKFAENIYNRFFAPKTHKRRYQAAKFNKQNSTWTGTSYTSNYILRQDLMTLRARARDMCRNNSHFVKFLQMAENNVIGPHGIRLQCTARDGQGKLDIRLNKTVEEAFWTWGHRETCSASKKLDWVEQQALFIRTLMRDGEVLVQKMQPAGNPYGFALKFIDVSYLDELYNEELQNGGRIIMSVEIDANGMPVAYWLTTPPSDIMFTKRRERLRTRVPADQMIHAFLVRDDESQVRGVTWFASPMLDAKNLQGYKEGVILSARVQSSVIGFLEKNGDDELPPIEGPEDPEGNERAVDIDVKPLAMNELPPGYKFNQLDPKQPTQNHEMFYKSMVRDEAAGLGVAYFDLQGDYAEVNFSSGRLGLNDSRDMWRGLQRFVGAKFCREVYHSWCQAAVANRMLKVSAAQFLEIQNPKFQGRGWPYIEPLKDITASSLALENKLSTWTDELAERGIDLADHLERMAAEQEMAKSYGIDLVIAPKKDVLPGAEDNPPADEKPSAKKNAGRGYTNGLHLDDLEN